MKPSSVIIFTLVAAILLALSGCIAGDRFYSPVVVANKDGSQSVKPVLVASLNRDAEGDITYADSYHSYSATLSKEWAGKFQTIEKRDSKGNLIYSEQRPVVARFSTSPVIRASGAAVAEGATPIVAGVVGGAVGSVVPVKVK